MKCENCGITYEPVDFPVVWPWPGSCKCSASTHYADDRQAARSQRLAPLTEKQRELYEWADAAFPPLKGDAVADEAPVAPERKPSPHRGVNLGED